jgi:hypothetical protein
MRSETPEIVGAQELVSRLGRWPSFHDAEIIQVQLVRDAPSSLTVRLMGPHDADAVVTFIFEHILDLTLTGEDVDRQNVIAELLVEKVNRATKLTFSPCYGLAGHILAERVSVRIDEISDRVTSTREVGD